MIYAEIIAGQIARYITASGPLPAHKLRPDLLPVVDVPPVFDPQTEVVTGHEDVIVKGQVERRPVIGVRPPDPVPEEVSDIQFIAATESLGIISFEEGAAYLQTGTLPRLMADALAQIPDSPEKKWMIYKAIGSKSFSRSDPVFKALVDAKAATDEQIDGVFRLAATLK